MHRKIYILCRQGFFTLLERDLWIRVVQVDVGRNQSSLEDKYGFDQACKSSRGLKVADLTYCLLASGRGSVSQRVGRR